MSLKIWIKNKRLIKNMIIKNVVIYNLELIIMLTLIKNIKKGYKLNFKATTIFTNPKHNRLIINIP